jgi:hypothetical protein
MVFRLKRLFKANYSGNDNRLGYFNKGKWNGGEIEIPYNKKILTEWE